MADNLTPEQVANLDRARELVEVGVPVWTMPPNPKYDREALAKLPNGSKNPAASEYRYPEEYQTWTAETVPAGHTLDDWRPGWAVCMSTGHGLDGVDVDPKNGAEVVAQLERLRGCAVQVVGVVVTPSGGAHFHTPSAGVCSTNRPAVGVDYRGRGVDGTGGGFLYLPGTERPKYGGAGYAWAQPVDAGDLEDLADPNPDNADAVATYLTGLGVKVRTRATSTDPIGGEPVEVEDLRPWLRALVEDLGPEWEVGKEGSRMRSRDRSERFFHLIAACRRHGLSQGQTVTLLDPWCHAVGKYPGRVSQEVARAWGRVVPEVEDYLGSLGALPESPSEALDRLEAAGTEGFTEAAGASESDPDDEGPPEVSTWSPVDLAAYLDGSYVPEVPSLFPRSDGYALLYAGRLHSFHGESESGKSLIIQGEAARLLGAGESVLVVDFESDAGAVMSRLLALGAPPEAIREGRLVYVRPDSGLRSPEARQALDEVLRRPYALAILDGVTEALALLVDGTGKPEEQVAAFVRLLPRRIARRTGAAVVQVDHVTKSTEGRGRFALGSQHKMNALDGAAYMVEVVEPLGIGLRGVVTLRVAKDRPGQVRPNAGPFRKSDRSQEAARIVLDATEPGRTVVTVEAPTGRVGDDREGAETWRPTGLMERVSRWLELQQEPISGAVVRRSVQGKDAAVLLALDTLVLEGWVTRTGGAHGAQLHASTRPYRQATDPRSDKYGGAGTGRDDEDPSQTPETDLFPVPRLRRGESGTGRDSLSTNAEEQDGNRTGTGEQDDTLDLYDTSRDPWTDTPLHACGGPSCSVPGCSTGAAS